ncbi:MAG: hypothetical protein KKE71_02385 [Nanoarchaeota archaeon]|nr:hypothetical protein [Nanoarchaeota archaeon]
MAVSEIPEIEVKSKLKEIEKKGFIKSLRKSDTGIGFTLETEMGIKENNTKGGDLTYNGKMVELKAQRSHATSNITLFTKEASIRHLNDVELLRKYGYSDVNGRVGLKITLTTNGFNPKNFMLAIDEKNNLLSLTHKNDDAIWSYTFNELLEKLKKKLSENLLIVLADSEKRKDGEYFHFNKAYLLSDISMDKFLGLLKDGKLVIEFRMHLKPNSISRNHGTGFRLNERYIPELYAKKEVLLG